jgi:hypothetical protein
MILRFIEAMIYLATLGIAGHIGMGARRINQLRDKQDR